MFTRVRNIFFGMLLLALLTAQATTLPGSARPSEGEFEKILAQAEATGEPVVRYATRTDELKMLRDIDPGAPRWADRVELPRKWLPNRPGEPGEPTIDPVLQDNPGVSAANVLASFEGVNNVNGVLPPDTVGDIGPNHYVQMVNLSFAIYDRSGNKLYGPANTNTLFAGFGGACETTNDGDPIVLYDHLADRWLMSQFALPKFPRGPFYECIAISKTGDPLGDWYRYEFTISTTKMNDYPHLGVWPDAYYMSMNQFNQGRLTWAGQGVVAFEREKMLQGQPARMVYFDLFNVNSNLGGMLPADLDGAVPPAGAPNPFAEVDDTSWGFPADQLQIWNFHVDWTTPANSTFTKVHELPVAAFDPEMCAGSRNCIPQPGGVAVDAIADRLMYRLQYRNFGSYQTMVVNHTVDVNGNNQAGIRWYELRNSGGGWSVYQQGTFAPDSNHRWMGSAAMNGKGEIALGYSISSTSIYPSIRFTGRLAGDPLGQMTQGEGTIVNGSGYQSHSAGRWGDYSMMAVDPTDDCTFWYTQEYYAQTANSAGWQTRVGSFRLTTCDGGPVDNPPSVTLTAPAEGATVSGTVNVTATASDDKGVTGVEFFVDGASIGVDTTAPYAASWDTTTATNGAHTVSATATDTIGQTASDSNGVTVSNGGTVTTLHVGDLDGSSAISGLRWTATVTITVHDANHNPVANATVSGDWSAGTTGSASCTTSSSGQCQVSKSSLPRRTTSVVFTVKNVTHATLTYTSAANHDPESDSNGTAITVKQ